MVLRLVVQRGTAIVQALGSRVEGDGRVRLLVSSLLVRRQLCFLGRAVVILLGDRLVGVVLLAWVSSHCSCAWYGVLLRLLVLRVLLLGLWLLRRLLVELLLFILLLLLLLPLLVEHCALLLLVLLLWGESSLRHVLLLLGVLLLLLVEVRVLLLLVLLLVLLLLVDHCLLVGIWRRRTLVIRVLVRLDALGGAWRAAYSVDKPSSFFFLLSRFFLFLPCGFNKVQKL
jgi:hypothetical protein